MTDPTVPAASSTWVEPEIYYAGLATVHVAAGALITDENGHVLLVKPNYQPYWLVPGGMAEEGEAPEDACVRELGEELGISIRLGRLLTVDWAPPYGYRTRPLVHLLFDGGTLRDTPIRLQTAELDDHAFVPVDRAVTMLSSATAARIPAALAARERQTTVYRPTGVRTG
ncbi:MULTISPECIES: NUDIX hydrolase [Streptosporangium]|uniref:NUDIX domain-containing protein n=1 Tax=Streptosporangium jomthongense TaxID=1193683 RepID=A0ABV8F8K9_9ACTN